MNTHGTILDNDSAQATTPNQILQIALAAWRHRNLVELVDQFNDQFTFTDHALALELTDKERLTEFFAKLWGNFPDSERRYNTSVSSGDRVITEWTLTATKAEPFIDGRLRKVPICVRGVSVVQIKDGKISEWPDYYDELKSRRQGVAALFTEWIEL